MYNVKTYITIQQIPTDDYPNRNRLLAFPYTVAFQGESSWQNLTSTFTVTCTKKMILKDVNDGTLIRLYGYDNTDGQKVPTNSNIGGYVGEIAPKGQVPAILRGDVITIQAGYETIKNGSDGSIVSYVTGQKDPTGVYKTIPTLFKGYVSRVNPGSPFTLFCEDNMWLLKQIPTPITQKDWSNKNLQQIVQSIIDSAKTLPKISKYGINLTVSKFSLTDLVFNVNNFITRGESLAEVLIRIKQQYKLDSYFRGDELRIGLTHYIPDDFKEHTFTFQKNIINNDSLQYQRKDDINLSMVVQSHYDEETGNTTADGEKVTKKRNTEILVYKNKKGDFIYTVKKKGEPYFKKTDIDVSGQRLSLNIYSLVPEPTKLYDMGKQYLKQFYYDGLRGSFDTFGIPYVKHGDGVAIVDPIITERNGKYMVKSVQYSFDCSSGFRQTIELDYRYDLKFI
jgi:hypothetical protein